MTNVIFHPHEYVTAVNQFVFQQLARGYSLPPCVEEELDVRDTPILAGLCYHYVRMVA
jgi:hypothetical protein